MDRYVVCKMGDSGEWAVADMEAEGSTAILGQLEAGIDIEEALAERRKIFVAYFPTKEEAESHAEKLNNDA